MTSEAKQSTITLGDIWHIIKGGWYFVTGFVVFAFIAAILYLNTATPTYTASMIVGPIFSEDGPAAGGFSRYANLAASIGINIGSDGNLTNFSLFMETLHSYQLAAALAKDESLMRKLYAPRWDENTGKWRDADELRSLPAKVFRTITGAPETPEPDAVTVQSYLRRNVLIDDPPTPFKTIQFNHRDPDFARKFLDLVYGNADELVRDRIQQRASTEASFLREQIVQSTLSEHRLALAALLAQKERLVMLSDSDIAFSAQLMQQPITSSEPTNPRRTLTIAVAVFLGLAAGFLFTLLFARTHDARGAIAATA